MQTQLPDRHPAQLPMAKIEQALIEEFIAALGYTSDEIRALPEDDRHELLCEASRYASGKLAQVESRADFIARLHRGGAAT